jgi:VIT1/CCC1 family predicted Fe2+/Mn2+ transporter
MSFWLYPVVDDQRGEQDSTPPPSQDVNAAAAGEPTHPAEPHREGASARLNRLRAAVLGANDGIVPVADIVLGVAGATAQRGPIFAAGLAGLVAGAVSMALGEYISVPGVHLWCRAPLRHRAELTPVWASERETLSCIAIAEIAGSHAM